MESKEGQRYQRARKRVKEIKGFYTHATAYVIVITVLIVLNALTVSFPWVIFPIVGWGLGLTAHGFSAFHYHPMFGKNWEERKIKELMDKDTF